MDKPKRYMGENKQTNKKIEVDKVKSYGLKFYKNCFQVK